MEVADEFHSKKAYCCQPFIKEQGNVDFLEDMVNAFQGDPVAIAKIAYTISQSPFFVREKLFWLKMEEFLNGVYLDEDDCSKLRVKLSEYGDKDEIIYRLIEFIDKAENKEKIHYLVNATRCVLTKDWIDMPTYFRICHAVTYMLAEDLQFLREHIEETNIPYNLNTQGCLSTGLMYQSTIADGGEQAFSFTYLAKLVDKYAISFDCVIITFINYCWFYY